MEEGTSYDPNEDSFELSGYTRNKPTTNKSPIASEQEAETSLVLIEECTIPPRTPTSGSKARIKPYRRLILQTSKVSRSILVESVGSQSAAIQPAASRVEQLSVISKDRAATPKERSYYGPKGSFSCIFYCYNCDFATKYKKRLKSHVIKHLTWEHCCEICSYKSCTKQHLNVHMKIHSGKKTFYCSKCEFKTMWKHSLVGHELTHSQEKSYRCHLCPFKSKTKGNLTCHLQIHNKVKKWKCSYCLYSAVQSHALKEHMTIHTGEKNHVCTQCDFKTNRRSTLRDHIRYKHEKVKEIQCPFCEYKSAHRGNMKSHTRIHTNERPYVCHICPYRARTSEVLKRHLMTHTGCRPYECELCSYRSSQESTMIEHVNAIHFKLAPFKCHHCGYRTARFRVLKTHIMNHLGIRVKACNYSGCTYRSDSQTKLNKHKLVHLPEKRHVCPTCFHRCTTARLLKHHLTIHEPLKLCCTECDFSTRRKLSLKMHMRNHNLKKKSLKSIKDID